MDKRTLIFMVSVSLAFFGVQYYFGETPRTEVKKTVQPVAINEKPALVAQYRAASSQGENFYVLENEYQQLVFSSRGGSLAEINLPLKNNTNPKSYVKEIDFDRTILATSPQNDRFPLQAYETPDNAHHDQGKLGGYYPLLRRGINGSNVPAEYYALNIVGEDPNVANANFQVTRFEANLIQFRGSVGQAQITKTYTIPKERNGPYCFNLDIQVDGDATGLWLSSGVPDVEIVSNSYSPLLRIQSTKNKVSDVDTIDLPKKRADPSRFPIA